MNPRLHRFTSHRHDITVYVWSRTTQLFTISTLLTSSTEVNAQASHSLKCVKGNILELMLFADKLYKGRKRVCVLIGLNVVFNNLSVISRRYLVAIGSSMLNFIVLSHCGIKSQTLNFTLYMMVSSLYLMRCNNSLFWPRNVHS